MDDWGTHCPPWIRTFWFFAKPAPVTSAPLIPLQHVILSFIRLVNHETLNLLRNWSLIQPYPTILHFRSLFSYYFLLSINTTKMSQAIFSLDLHRSLDLDYVLPILWGKWVTLMDCCSIPLKVCQVKPHHVLNAATACPQPLIQWKRPISFTVNERDEGRSPIWGHTGYHTVLRIVNIEARFRLNWYRVILCILKIFETTSSNQPHTFLGLVRNHQYGF